MKQQQVFTSPLPTSPQSRCNSTIRNTLSSRTSVLGRRLAEERSRNHQLTLELEHVKSLLEKEKKKNDDLNDSFYSSSPVNTPTTTPVKYRGAAIATAAMETERSNNNSNNNYNNNNSSSSNTQRIQELELELQTEIHLRNEVQMKFLVAEQHAKTIEEKLRNSLKIYLQRATHLITSTNNTGGSSTNSGFKKHVGSHDSYNSLHSIDEDDEEEEDKEKEEDYDIDNDDNEEQHIEENTSPSNILQKMQEYEELVTSFHSEQQGNQDEMMSKDDVIWFFQELKWRFADIYRGVTVLVSKNHKSSKAADATLLQQGNNCEEWKNCLIGLVDELEHLMQKMHDHSSMDNDVDESDEFNKSVEDMRRSYEEQLAAQLRTIQQLEADAIELDEHYAEIQRKIQQDYHFLEEEKRKLSLSKDGTSARIKYLEDIINNQKTPKNEKRNVTQSHSSNYAKDNNSNGDNHASEIDALAKALADSELNRALLIDEFQAEREKYRTQYKQMSDALKQFMDSENK